MSQDDYIKDLKNQIEYLKGMIKFKDEMIREKDKHTLYLWSLINGEPIEDDKPNWKVYRQSK